MRDGRATGVGPVAERCMTPDGDLMTNPAGPGPQPPLQRIHSDATLQSGSAKCGLDYWRQQPTDVIVRSLAPGNREALRVKPDGRIMNGNTRIKVLEER